MSGLNILCHVFRRGNEKEKTRYSGAQWRPAGHFFQQDKREPLICNSWYQMRLNKSSIVRLNKFIAEQTGVSRREADEMIAAGKVRVDNEIAILGQQISEQNQVFINNKLMKSGVEHVALMLNKPVGYLSSRRSQGGNPTVYDLLPIKYKNLKTAGRLDKDSSGLMIMSSDGDLIQRLTHPKYEKIKIYEIELNKPLEPLHRQMISDFGVDLPDGKSHLILTELGAKLGCNKRRWRVTMSEGRNRQIRRTFAALGYSVIKLNRIQLGGYKIGNLELGKYCIIH